MKVNDLFFFGLQLKLSWRFCQAETETLFQKSWIRHWTVMTTFFSCFSTQAAWAGQLSILYIYIHRVIFLIL